jgi:hypothetical protein
MCVAGSANAPTIARRISMSSARMPGRFGTRSTTGPRRRAPREPGHTDSPATRRPGGCAAAGGPRVAQRSSPAARVPPQGFGRPG